MAQNRDNAWRWRDIEWKQLWARQDYANFCLTACLIVATVVVTVVGHPHKQPYLLWDARISMPLDAELDEIPSWAAVFAPLMMLALTVGVGEFVTSRRMHNNFTDAWSTAIFFFLDGVQSFVMGILLTQVFKYTVGRLRPNFLVRCQPDIPEGTVFSLTNITNSVQYSQQYPCKGSEDSVDEGRLAFPSGHTSACFNLAVYACGYLLWVWHWRHPCPRRLSFAQEFRADLLNVLAKIWMLAMLCFAWGVGVSRIIDYQHDPSDVLAGALLGTMIALVYLLRAIPRWRRVLAPEREGLPGPFTSGDVEIPIMSTNGAGTGPSSSTKQRVEVSRAGGELV